MNPAKVNLTPANRICDIVCPLSISNKRYPIFIHGNAEPHNKQQIPANRTTTGIHDNLFCFTNSSFFLLTTTFFLPNSLPFLTLPIDYFKSCFTVSHVFQIIYTDCPVTFQCLLFKIFFHNIAAHIIFIK